MYKVVMRSALFLSVLMFIVISRNDEVVYTSDVMIMHSVIPKQIFANVSSAVIMEPLEDDILSSAVTIEPLEDDVLPYEDVSLIALITMAEAEGECEEGKRLVIDTILNRVDSEYFPDNVYDVIYQRNQFSSIWNGRIDRCEVKEDICELVREELISRTNTEVVFFTAGEYGRYGFPMFQVGNHYFSSYE